MSAFHGGFAHARRAGGLAAAIAHWAWSIAAAAQAPFARQALGTGGDCRAWRARRSLSRSLKRLTNPVDLGGADEVVLRQPADGVGAVAHAALVVADLEIRVMVLDVGHVRQGVDEAHGAVEVAKGEFATHGLAVFRPGTSRIESCSAARRRLRGASRRHAAFAGFAMAFASSSVMGAHALHAHGYRCAPRTARPAPGIPRRCARP